MGKSFSQDQDVNPSPLPAQSFEIKNVSFAECEHMGHLIMWFAILLNHQEIKEANSFAIGRASGRGE